MKVLALIGKAIATVLAGIALGYTGAVTVLSIAWWLGWLT